MKTRALGTRALVFALLPVLGAHAQSLPPAVAACAAEADVLKRLSCFDREVAPYLSQPRGAASPAAAAAGAPQPAIAAAPSESPPPPAPRIASIDNYPGGIVLHLDNGQAWQEDEDTPVDLGLRVGDSVKLERVVGSWWVTGRNGATAKVRLQHP